MIQEYSVRFVLRILFVLVGEANVVRFVGYHCRDKAERYHEDSREFSQWYANGDDCVTLAASIESGSFPQGWRQV